MGASWVGAPSRVKEGTAEMSDGEPEAWVRTLGWNEGTQRCTLLSPAGKAVGQGRNGGALECSKRRQDPGDKEVL